MKRVLIFAASAGGAHVANARAIRDYIQGQQGEISIEILDHWKILGQSLSIFIYNFCLKYNLITLYEKFLRPSMLAIRSLSFLDHWLSIYMGRYFRSLPDSPDLVISNSPIFNHVIANGMIRAWGKLAPPLLIVFCDLEDYVDQRMSYIPERSDQIAQLSIHFLCFTKEQINKVLAMKYPDSSVIRTSGFIIAQNFYKFRNLSTTEIASFREACGLDKSLPTILISFGGQGNTLAYEIARQIIAENYKVQVIFICGRNQKLIYQLEKLSFPYPRQILSYTNDMGRYIAISDYVIGKPGPASISESMYMQVPFLGINTGETMEQEKPNARLLTHNKVGGFFQSVEQVLKHLETSLNQDKYDAYPDLTQFQTNDALESAAEAVQRLSKSASSESTRL